MREVEYQGVFVIVTLRTEDDVDLTALVAEESFNDHPVSIDQQVFISWDAAHLYELAG